MKLTRFWSTTLLVLVSSAVLAFSSSLAAKQLRFAVGYPSNAAAVHVAERYAETLADYSDGELSVRVFPMTLLNAAETSAGTRDGIADIGFLLTVYFPSEYPHTNFVNESAMQLQLLDDPATVRANAPMAFQAAMAEFTLFHCPECNDEYARQNQVYISNATSVTYGLLCTEPVTSAADLRGKRIRVAGSH